MIVIALSPHQWSLGSVDVLINSICCFSMLGVNTLYVTNCFRNLKTLLCPFLNNNNNNKGPRIGKEKAIVARLESTLKANGANSPKAKGDDKMKLEHVQSVSQVEVNTPRAMEEEEERPKNGLEMEIEVSGEKGKEKGVEEAKL